jgi:5-(carboxyamino)imidazole ribonucleotide synthase
VDVVTIESENIHADVLQGLNLYPNSRAVGIAQDRLLEKRFFHECGIGTAPFAPVDSLEDLKHALEITGLPAILKTRRMGYDGKGQARLRSSDDATNAWSEIGEVPCILEGMELRGRGISHRCAQPVQTGRVLSPDRKPSS